VIVVKRFLEYMDFCSSVPRLCWKLDCDPQSTIGMDVNSLMCRPEPSWSESLYRLSSGRMEEFLDIEYDWNCGFFRIRLIIMPLFDKLIRRQREVILANLLDIFKMCKGMVSDEQTLCYIRSSFSGRLNTLMQMENHPGDFGQHEGAKQ